MSFALLRPNNQRHWVTGVCLALTFTACHRHSEESAPLPVTARAGDGGATPSPAGAPSASTHAKASSAKTNADRREACVYRAGANPRDTLNHDDPTGTKIPIDHFVVVLQENRSFDQYFQALPQAGQPDVDVAPRSYENPDPSGEGEIVHPYLLSDPCIPDVPHNWIAVHHQLADGKMTGFLAAANPDGKRALGYYDQSTLGYYYALANTFAIGDRYFASASHRRPGPEKTLHRRRA